MAGNGCSHRSTECLFQDIYLSLHILVGRPKKYTHFSQDIPLALSKGESMFAFGLPVFDFFCKLALHSHDSRIVATLRRRSWQLRTTLDSTEDARYLPCYNITTFV